METQTENQSLRRYIVTLKKGVDYDSFYHDMETVTDNIPHIPNRAVAIATWLPHSSRNTFYLLTADEARQLKNDSRVLAVVFSIEGGPDDIGVPYNIQAGNFNRPTNNATGGQGSYKNWGLLRCAFPTNIYGTDVAPSTSDYPYHLDGTGVDYVVNDTGIELNHPEFQDANGINRIQQIDWIKESLIDGVDNGYTKQSSLFYRDLNGHGTHVASISAGKTFGWAKNARIYMMKINLGQPDYESNGTTFTGYSPLQGMAIMRQWHENKPVDTVTGKKRPTVVNMSWGKTPYSWASGSTASDNLKTIIKGIHRGVSWTKSTADTESTLAQYGFPLIKSYSARSSIAENAEMDDLADAGVHVCVAAGNDNLYCDIPGGASYNDSVVSKYTNTLLQYVPDIAEGSMVIDNATGWSALVKVDDEIVLIPVPKFPIDFYDHRNYTHDTIYYKVTKVVSDNKIEIWPPYNSFGIMKTVNPTVFSGTITGTTQTTTITGIASTTGLTAGMVITRLSGDGQFGGTSTIVTVDSSTQITIKSAIVSNVAGSITFTAPFSSTVRPSVFVGSPTYARYHRPGSPYSEKCIMVGNVDSKVQTATLERSSTSSNRGPFVDIWAPGTNITAAVSNKTNPPMPATTYAYYENSNFKQICINGTSMASPQVAGVVALYLQLNPDATPAETKQFIINSSVKNAMYDAVPFSYTDLASIRGGPNRLLYFPYANDNGLGADVTLKGEGGQANNLKIAPVAYTYAEWAVEYGLTNTEKLLGINIANLLFLSKVKLGFQYPLTFHGTILGNVAGYTGANSNMTVQSDASPTNAGLTVGMVITKLSGTGAFGGGNTTTISSVPPTGVLRLSGITEYSVGIQSSADNTIGTIDFNITLDVYGLNRKPDTAGLEYWTRRCLKTNPAYVNPGDTWTAGDYTSTAFKKAFCDGVHAGGPGADLANFFFPLSYQGGYWTNGDFSDKGINP